MCTKNHRFWYSKITSRCSYPFLLIELHIYGCTMEGIAGFAGLLHCAGGGTRTHTRLPSPDFESGLGTIPGDTAR